MKDFSEASSGAFNDVRESQIVTLVSLLQSSRIRNIDYIRRRYRELAPQFDRTLTFLSEIAALQHERDDLVMTPVLQRTRADCRAGMPWPQSLSILSWARRVVSARNYWITWVALACRMAYLSTDRRSSSEVQNSALRNLLMEWKVVTFDTSANQYVLAAEHAALYARRGCVRNSFRERSSNGLGGKMRTWGSPPSAWLFRTSASGLGQDFAAESNMSHSKISPPVTIFAVFR